MHKVLIVEDEQTLLDLVKTSLEISGYKVLTAGNGEDAINLITEEPDIILLDILLPGQSGIEILHKIRELPKGKDIPVVVLSNFNDQEKIRAVIDAGAINYILKSNQDLESIPKMIKEVLNKAENTKNP